MNTKTSLVMEANWFGRAADLGGGEIELDEWGTPDAVELRRETETLDADGNVIDESGEVLKNLPAMLPESEWAEVLSDSQDSELDHTKNRCLRVRLLTPSAADLAAAIQSGFNAGAPDEWDAQEFETARKLTECTSWDFDGWRPILRQILVYGYVMLGGKMFA